MIQPTHVAKYVHKDSLKDGLSRFQSEMSNNISSSIGKDTNYVGSSFSSMLGSGVTRMFDSISNDTLGYGTQYPIGQKNVSTDYSIGLQKNNFSDQSQKDIYAVDMANALVKNENKIDNVQSNSSEVSLSYVKRDETNVKEIKTDSKKESVEVKETQEDKEAQVELAKKEGDEVKQKDGKNIAGKKNGIRDAKIHIDVEELQSLADDKVRFTNNNGQTVSEKEALIVDQNSLKLVQKDEEVLRNDEKEDFLKHKTKTNSLHMRDKTLVQRAEHSLKEIKDNKAGESFKDGLSKNTQSSLDQDVVNFKQVNTHSVKAEAHNASLDKTSDVGGNANTVTSAVLSDDLTQKMQVIGKNEGITQKVFSQLQKGGNDTLVQQAKLVLQDGGRGQIKLQFSPKELGEVKLTVQLDSNNVVHAKAIVSSDQARDAMQKNLGNLAKEFQQEGYDLGSFSVSVDSNSSKFSFEKQEENTVQRKKEHSLCDSSVHENVRSYIRTSSELNLVM